MKIFGAIILLGLAHCAFADTNSYTIAVDPKTYPPSAFKQPGVKVVPLKNQESETPSVEKRDSTFAKVPGLNEKISGWDDLDKNLLYMRAKSRSLPELKSLYTKLSSEQLKSLSRLTKAKP